MEYRGSVPLFHVNSIVNSIILLVERIFKLCLLGQDMATCVRRCNLALVCALSWPHGRKRGDDASACWQAQPRRCLPKIQFVSPTSPTRRTRGRPERKVPRGTSVRHTKANSILLDSATGSGNRYRVPRIPSMPVPYLIPGGLSMENQYCVPRFPVENGTRHPQPAPREADLNGKPPRGTSFRPYKRRTQSPWTASPLFTFTHPNIKSTRGLPSSGKNARYD